MPFSKPPASILIVDDDRIHTQISADLLRSNGFAVSEVFSAPAALKLFRPGHFDILLIDLDLPEVDGPQLLIQLRHASAVRAIALTDQPGEAEQSRARAAGFDAYLVKPVSMDLLLSAVRSLLDYRPMPTPSILPPPQLVS